MHRSLPFLSSYFDREGLATKIIPPSSAASLAHVAVAGSSSVILSNWGGDAGELHDSGEDQAAVKAGHALLTLHERNLRTEAVARGGSRQ